MLVVLGLVVLAIVYRLRGLRIGCWAVGLSFAVKRELSMDT